MREGQKCRGLRIAAGNQWEAWDAKDKYAKARKMNGHERAAGLSPAMTGRRSAVPTSIPILHIKDLEAA
jgi:hypothetical protein